MPGPSRDSAPNKASGSVIGPAMVSDVATSAAPPRTRLAIGPTVRCHEKLTEGRRRLLLDVRHAAEEEQRDAPDADAICKRDRRVRQLVQEDAAEEHERRRSRDHEHRQGHPVGMPAGEDAATRFHVSSTKMNTQLQSMRRSIPKSRPNRKPFMTHLSAAISRRGSVRAHEFGATRRRCFDRVEALHRAYPHARDLRSSRGFRQVPQRLDRSRVRPDTSVREWQHGAIGSVSWAGASVRLPEPASPIGPHALLLVLLRRRGGRRRGLLAMPHPGLRRSALARRGSRQRALHRVSRRDRRGVAHVAARRGSH